MEDLQHDLLPGCALQSSQCGDTGLAWATVRVSRAVVSVLQLRDSARPQVGPAHWGGQTCLTRLRTLNMLTAGLTCRYQSGHLSYYTTFYHTISLITLYHTIPQYTTLYHTISQYTKYHTIPHHTIPHHTIPHYMMYTTPLPLVRGLSMAALQPCVASQG